jgi:Na+-transporting NADH:ubiquinone oxidoreductase subunit NqrC
MIFASMLVISTSTMFSQDGARLHALAANDTSPTFSLTLSPGLRNKIVSEYRVGSDMWMTIVQTNLTNHDIDCSDEDAGGYDRMYGYEAIDEDGKPVERRHQGTESYNHGCGIGAGGNVTSEFLLNRVFKLDRPGKYVIRVSRQVPFVKDEKGESPVVWSNPITITIIG